MRHKKAFRKLNRTPAHRRALLRNLATALVLHNQIETTLPKAKELKRVADKLVTLGKRNSLHARRLVMRYLMPINQHVEGNAQKLSAVHKLFTEIAPRYASRAGGYTRVLRTRVREGDKTQLAVIQFVEEAADKTAKRKRRVVTRSEKTAAAPTSAAESRDEAAQESTAEG